MRLLIVDDDPITAEALGMAFSVRGHVVATLFDGGRVLDHVRDGKYDMVILDQRMPTLDGISTIRTLRQAGLGVVAILVTAVDAHVADGLRQKLDTLQPAALVRKPASTQELLAAAETLLIPQES